MLNIKWVVVFPPSALMQGIVSDDQKPYIFYPKKAKFLFHLDGLDQEHEAHIYSTRQQKMFTLHAGTPTRQLYPMKPIFNVQSFHD